MTFAETARRVVRWSVVAGVLLCCTLPSIARAQRQGFRIDRSQGAVAGSGLFAITRPWYATTRWFAAGVTLGYAHNALRLPDSDGAIVSNALLGSIDLAGSPSSWLLLSASLPVTFLERGRIDASSGIAPIEGAAVGDPRLGFMVRLWGDAERSRFSAHFGIDGWAPIGGAPRHQGDAQGRLLPHLVLAGAFKDRGRYAVEVGFLYRPDAIIGTTSRGAIAGSEAQLGLALGWNSLAQRLYLGVELRIAARVTGYDLGTGDRVRSELLFGGHYLLWDQLHIGAAIGTSALGFPLPGSPDVQALLRIAWAPRRLADADRDGVPDVRDRCPNEPEDQDGYRDEDGCPELSRDAISVRVVPAGAPSARTTAPATTVAVADSDQDGISDAEDRCPLTQEDRDGFEDEDGCPDPDNDGDGIADERDRCPLEAETSNGQDDDDGCPEVAGARVQITANRIVLKEQVRFRPDKAFIDPRSLPLLRELAELLRQHPDYAIEVQGHTDNLGNPQRNLRLSQLRAEAVCAFLRKVNIDAQRLAAKGYGSTRPLTSNKTAQGRLQNRRVEIWLQGTRR